MTKYAQIVSWVHQQIACGLLNEGDKLYTESALCERFGVSRQTVRQALGLLATEGVISRQRGSGSYIRFSRAAPKAAPTMNIGVLSTYIDDYIFPGIIRAMEKVLRKSDYSMQLSFTNNRIENERQALKSYIDKQSIDGLIAEPTNSALPNPNLTLYARLIEMGKPVLFFNAYYPGFDVPHVALDDRAAGRLATQHLLDMGHRAIAGIFKADDIQGHLRYAGYLDALIAHGLAPGSKSVFWYTTEDIPDIGWSAERVVHRLAGGAARGC